MDSSYSVGRREPGSRKKVYRKPETLSREVLEALAVVCNPGKANGMPPDCNLINQS